MGVNKIVLRKIILKLGCEVDGTADARRYGSVHVEARRHGRDIQNLQDRISQASWNVRRRRQARSTRIHSQRSVVSRNTEISHPRFIKHLRGRAGNKLSVHGSSSGTKAGRKELIPTLISAA